MQMLGDASIGRRAKAQANVAAAQKAAVIKKAAHLAYVDAENIFKAKAQAQAQAMWDLTAAMNSGVQATINNAIQTCLYAENDAMNAGIAATFAATQDSSFIASYDYAAMRKYLLPAGGFWNEGTAPYNIGPLAYAALKQGLTVYDFYPGGNGHTTPVATISFCNGFWRANPGAPLNGANSINDYGQQIIQAARDSGSFGSFLRGALPYIALTVAVGAVLVATAGTAAPAVVAASTGEAGSFTAAAAATAGTDVATATAATAATTGADVTAAAVTTGAEAGGSSFTAALSTAAGEAKTAYGVYQTVEQVQKARDASSAASDRAAQAQAQAAAAQKATAAPKPALTTSGAMPILALVGMALTFLR